MPQKSKTPAARPSIVGKAKLSSKNPKTKAAKPAAVGANTKVTAKLSTKAAKPKAKDKVSPKAASKAVTPDAVDKAPPQQIEKAKAALKKEKVAVSAAPAKPMSKARARKLGIEVSANEAASALAAKWALLFKKSDQIESKPYNMKAAFDEKTAIVHKVLGWGYILANRNDRLEVLFKDGIKYLISNYKL